MDQKTAADDITDAIALIEMHRQDSTKAAGLAAACNEALRKLHEMLDHEQEAVQRHGADTCHPANIGVLTAAIEKVKNLSGSGNQGASRGHVRGQGPKRIPPPSAPHNPPRNRGRRTMGRRGDR